MRAARGFTIIELLVVISIIGLLSSVVLASMNSAREKGRRAAAKQMDGNFYRSLGDSLEAEYLFDECSGSTTRDSSGTSNTGTLTNSPSWSSSSPFPSGCALTFNGSNTFVTTPSLNIDTAVTASAWAYSDNFNQNGFVVGKNPVNSQWEIFFEGPTLIWRGGNPISNAVSCPAPANSKWHLFIGVQNGTQASLYIDGKQCDTDTITAIGNGNGTVDIGRFNGGYYFNGSIDNVRIYSRALETAEIQKIYAQEAPRHNLASSIE